MSLQNRVRIIAMGRAAAAPQTEHCNRRSKRKPTALPAGLTFKGMRIAVPCTVADMSGTGAKIVLPAAAQYSFGDLEHLPSKLTLQLKADCMEIDCEVVWRRQGKLGLRFLSPPRPVPRSAIR